MMDLILEALDGAKRGLSFAELRDRVEPDSSLLRDLISSLVLKDRIFFNPETNCYEKLGSRAPPRKIAPNSHEADVLEVQETPVSSLQKEYSRLRSSLTYYGVPLKSGPKSMPMAERVAWMRNKLSEAKAKRKELTGRKEYTTTGKTEAKTHKLKSDPASNTHVVDLTSVKLRRVEFTVSDLSEIRVFAQLRDDNSVTLVLSNINACEVELVPGLVERLVAIHSKASELFSGLKIEALK